jgi:hypothetical protein
VPIFVGQPHNSCQGIANIHNKYSKQICNVCADICETCAKECEQYADMEPLSKMCTGM